MIGSEYRRGGESTRRVSACRAGACRAALGVLLLAAVAMPGAAGASVRVDPRDRAATHAYLVATYDYAKALLANASASRASFEAMASRIGGECPGVLAGAPTETIETLFGSHRPAPSSRQLGEANRERRQMSDLKSELSFALALALIEPDRQAVLADADAVRSLTWSDRTLTLLERAGAMERERELQATPPAVCADMRAWVTSGYRTLSPASKAFAREREAKASRLLHYLRRAGSRQAIVTESATESLARYEGPAEQALARKIDRLESDWLGAVKPVEVLDRGLLSTLGEAPEPAPKVQEGPPKGSVVIGRGRTAAGGSYTIRLEPRQRHSPPSCRLTVAISETDKGTFSVGESSSARCLSLSHPERPRVNCNGGLLSIEAQTLPRARSVRLRLSNGRQITSRVAIVPPGRGGPTGLYYQVVRGPSPVPVSLSELDARGRVLRTVELRRVAECAAQPVHYLPGGLRTILRARAPGGPAFSIVGQHYRFQGHVYFDLSIELGEEANLGGADGSIISVGNIGSSSGRRPSPFSSQIEEGCRPHEYAVVYGLLKAPGDIVFARIAGALRPLRHVHIPASLHADGVLAYIALPSVPVELLVRTPDGRTIATEKLGDLARETSERCQGEAEGPSGSA
jgi:hypothetical protein